MSKAEMPAAATAAPATTAKPLNAQRTYFLPGAGGF